MTSSSNPQTFHDGSMKHKWLYQFLSPNRRIVPYLVLLGTLILTAIATYYVESTAFTQDQLQFEASVSTDRKPNSRSS
ncbi:MAG: hypothetical protein RSE13_01720 [Planktothrix sp. GU0601_MAG3]|nr:MAG: hypothetical protein RSE13_01720 [Planktothrix sp. GU0601_MAG3]